jgi:hypothetical protein
MCSVPGRTSVCPAWRNPNIDHLNRAQLLSRLPSEVNLFARCKSSWRLFFSLAESGVNLEGYGLVPRCAACEHGLLRLVNAPHRVWPDMRRMEYVRFHASEVRHPAAKIGSSFW